MRTRQLSIAVLVLFNEPFASDRKKLSVHHIVAVDSLVGSSSRTSSLLCRHAPSSTVFSISASVRLPILLFDRDEALIRGLR